MPAKKKTAKKSNVKVKDLKAKKNPKGGYGDGHLILPIASKVRSP